LQDSPLFSFRILKHKRNHSPRKTTWNNVAYLGLLVLLIKSLAIVWPQGIEQFYTHGFYPFWHFLWCKIAGWIPFSIGDVGYVAVIIWLIRAVIRHRTHPIAWAGVVKKSLVVYLVFLCSWGLQYNRLPLLDLPEKENKNAYQALCQLTQKLIWQTNALHVQLQANSSQRVLWQLSEDQMQQQAVLAAALWPKKWTSIADSQQLMLKPSLFGTGLSYMGFSGYLNPFTLESQVNEAQPKVLQPFVGCHELAHQQGVAAEGMCNYLGYWATQKSADLYVNYSGKLAALRYCLSAINKSHPKQAKLFKAALCVGLQKEMRAITHYWRSHESWLQEGFLAFYDTFLKWNQQEKGLDEYGEFVRLLLRYPVG